MTKPVASVGSLSTGSSYPKREIDMTKHFLAGAALAFALIAPQAFGAGTPTLPAGFVLPTGTRDASKAIAGNYKLDPNHVAVLARVSHMGFSISVFRFEKATASLIWNPTAVAKSKVTAEVETGSIATNVPGFAEQLKGKDYLDAGTYPKATFVSRAFHQKDATHGTVSGDFTLKGKTHPVMFAVTLVGAGPGFAGSMEMGHVIGMHAETNINPQDFGLPAVFTDPIQLVVDTEFDRTKALNP
jgi:polyisoprenoid-binding protein YceI